MDVRMDVCLFQLADVINGKIPDLVQLLAIRSLCKTKLYSFQEQHMQNAFLFIFLKWRAVHLHNYRRFKRYEIAQCVSRLFPICFENVKFEEHFPCDSKAWFPYGRKCRERVANHAWHYQKLTTKWPPLAETNLHTIYIRWLSIFNREYCITGENI